ncbi:D-2-hydroxyacid dehydrogenase [Gallaecimonas sp. GXIMD1310]|uniref:D-2-hydroxyacid dehydrogenase n=1 Tax=Gallaecimonas sp. GXIMD1310 TaxID=3131926 RepID=UPI003249DDC1
MKAVFLDAETLGDVDLAPLKAVCELTVYPQTAPEALPERLAGQEIVITNKVVIPAAVMANLKGICVTATGTNNIDMAAARALNLPVKNVVNYGTRSVAQHTLMLMLSLAAQLPRYEQALRQRQWQHSSGFCLMQHPTLELAGKTLVIVGAGTLGTAVAALAQAFGMTVRFSARPGSSNDSRPAFTDLLPEADVLSFHCPLTDATTHLLNAQTLPLIKPGCLVVNCARGGIIDEQACLAALRQGTLGGLAVDVLPEEPPVSGHALLDALHEDINLIITPHNAWISQEARQNIVNLTADNVQAIRA